MSWQKWGSARKSQNFCGLAAGTWPGPHREVSVPPRLPGWAAPRGLDQLQQQVPEPARGWGRRREVCSHPTREGGPHLQTCLLLLERKTLPSSTVTVHRRPALCRHWVGRLGPSGLCSWKRPWRPSSCGGRKLGAMAGMRPCLGIWIQAKMCLVPTLQGR